MKPTRTILCFALSMLCSTLSSAFAQTSNGFVGVYGDAAATIRCMEAAAGVPTTLYVVASTAGTTANGISGAEFRIEFTNPSGYFLSYTAPSGVQALGDPLSSAGFNIAWPSCQIPIAGKVQLGTIMVFNAGSGGQTSIIVKRKNPPSNSSYQCALLVQCDTPVYSQSCMTAPADSVSCLSQKTRLDTHELETDEFATFLDGYQAPAQYAVWEGYSSYRSAGYTGAASVITTTFPLRVDFSTKVWVGIRNSALPATASSKWIQAGYARKAGEATKAYYEYCTDSGYPSGWSQAVYRPEPPTYPTGSYTVRQNGFNTLVFTGGFSWTVPAWSSFDGLGNFVETFYGAEQGHENDCIPGCNNPSEYCTFSSAIYFDSAGAPHGQDFSLEYCDHHTTSHSGATGQGLGTFSIYDTRMECCAPMLRGKTEP